MCTEIPNLPYWSLRVFDAIYLNFCRMVDGSNTEDMQCNEWFLLNERFTNCRGYTEQDRDDVGRLEGDGRCPLKVLARNSPRRSEKNHEKQFRISGNLTEIWNDCTTFRRGVQCGTATPNSSLTYRLRIWNVIRWYRMGCLVNVRGKYTYTIKI
jgi:hypothetical protein